MEIDVEVAQNALWQFNEVCSWLHEFATEAGARDPERGVEALEAHQQAVVALGAFAAELAARRDV